MSRIINLCPHDVAIIDRDTEEVIVRFAPEPFTARVIFKTEVIMEVNGVPVVKSTTGAIRNLPEPEEDTYYIVSSFVAEQAVGRMDLLVPNRIIYSERGQKVGCEQLLQYWNK